jgi:RNA polymerase sigma-70 factor, ECF subfamily
VYEADRELVARMRAGEQRAFEDFFRTSANRLAAFVARRSGLDSGSIEDIVQNSLIKAVRNLADYRGDAALHTWLTSICIHELADSLRRVARRPRHDSLDVPSNFTDSSLRLRIPDHQEPPGELDAAQGRAAVIRALNALPDRYAHALEAKYADGLPVDQVAAMLGLTVTAAQSLLARAREAFREQWRKASAEAAAEFGPRD